MPLSLLASLPLEFLSSLAQAWNIQTFVVNVPGAAVRILNANFTTWQ